MTDKTVTDQQDGEPPPDAAVPPGEPAAEAAAPEDDEPKVIVDVARTLRSRGKAKTRASPS